jgi:hypothetical protein
MGTALKNRLNGNKQDFLNDVKRYGEFRALNKWSEKLGGYHDILGLHKFLKEETGDENYGAGGEFAPLNSQANDTVLDVFISKFKDYILKTDAKMRQQEDRIQMLQRQLAAYQNIEVDKVESELGSAIEMCER